MRRSATLALGLCATAALALITSTSAGAPGPRVRSWVDAKHGWRVSSNTVQSTENGGRSWRTIFPGDGGNTLDMLRLTRQAGLVSVIFQRTYPDTYWTRDNGRHWYLADWKVLDPSYTGRRDILYTWDAGSVYRISRWPPTTNPRCRRGFSVQGRARICRDEVHMAGMRARVLARSPEGQEFEDLRLVPDGFVSLAYPRTPWEAPPQTPSVVRRLNGENRTISLPTPELPPDMQVRHVYFPRWIWPRLAVFGSAESEARTCQRRVCATVRWQSADGGDTWSVTTTPLSP